MIEIYIKVGLPDHIYTTPFKEDDSDDYGCYIKLNGAVKKNCRWAFVLVYKK